MEKKTGYRGLAADGCWEGTESIAEAFLVLGACFPHSVISLCWRPLLSYRSVATLFSFYNFIFKTALRPTQIATCQNFLELHTAHREVLLGRKILLRRKLCLSVCSSQLKKPFYWMSSAAAPALTLNVCHDVTRYSQSIYQIPWTYFLYKPQCTKFNWHLS
jgi:hypothetical protein